MRNKNIFGIVIILLLMTNLCYAEPFNKELSYQKTKKLYKAIFKNDHMEKSGSQLVFNVITYSLQKQGKIKEQKDFDIILDKFKKRITEWANE